MLGETEERRSADNGEASVLQDLVESMAVRLEASGRCIQPGVVGKRCSPDLQCGTRDRPRSEFVAQGKGEVGIGDGEAHAKAGEAVGLAKGTQHHGARRQPAREAGLGR